LVVIPFGPMVDQRVAPELLGLEIVSSLRLSSPQALHQMQQSLIQHGQMTTVLVFDAGDDRLEVIDGLKRARAARDLGLETLLVRALAVDRIQAKAAIVTANASSGLDELEEGWVIRSLYRDDDLSQPQIAHLLGRHKSWVCRRLMLAEHLDSEVEVDVRLGLISATCARELARLPRGNQTDASKVVMRRGLTTRQTAQLVQAVLEAGDDERTALLLRALESNGPPASARPRTRSPLPLEALSSDVAALVRIAGRLQARLCERPLSTFGQAAATLVATTLVELRSVLDALSKTIARVTQEAPPQ
jgi:ParB-like chromosome segregation protein Spo0J